MMMMMCYLTTPIKCWDYIAYLLDEIMSTERRWSESNEERQKNLEKEIKIFWWK